MSSNVKDSVGLAETRQVLAASFQQLAAQVDSQPALPSEPIHGDPYVVSSLLQKSIRRSERDIAQRAALTLFRMRGSTIWRRFMVRRLHAIGL
jgi:hypothetical protein